MKKVKTDFKEIVNEIDEKRKANFSSRRTAINLTYLLLPALLLLIIISLNLYSFFLSLLLIYFILPMFYIVDKRIRSNVSNIGDKNVTYKKGYDDFFGAMSGGIYGIIVGIFYFVLLFFIFYFVFSALLPILMNLNPESKEAYDMIINNEDNNQQIINLFYSSLHKMYKPLIIFIATIEFVPISFFFMFYIERNLSNHHMMSIILPDADKNLSASYQESICEYTFAKYYRKDRFKLNLYYNWPYVLAHTLLYATLAYLFYLIDCHDFYSAIFFISLFTGLVSFIDIFLSYFIVQNDYYIVEAISCRLLSKLPYNLQEMIRNSFYSNSYIHGEESALRGPFIPSKNYYENKTDEINKGNNDLNDQNNDNSESKISSTMIDLSNYKDNNQEK